MCRHSGGWLPFGSIGVDLFLVISGFVISGAAQKATATSFLLDRAWRIFPIYWVLIIPWLVAFDPRPLDESLVDQFFFPRWWLYGFSFSWGQMWTLA